MAAHQLAIPSISSRPSWRRRRTPFALSTRYGAGVAGTAAYGCHTCEASSARRDSEMSVTVPSVTTDADLATLTEQAVPHAAVGRYLAEQLGDDGWRDCRLDLISGGKSNLTFGVISAAGEAVLRRPPLSNRLPTAHDMGREHRVMTALGPTPVPVPPTLAMCIDEEVIG